jgi:hypothetical protein
MTAPAARRTATKRIGAPKIDHARQSSEAANEF